MLGPVIKQISVVGQAVGLTVTAMKVYNSTSPVQAVRTAAVSIVDDCAPPQIKYPLKCGALLIQLRIAIGTSGNAWSVRLALGAAKQFIE